MTGDTVRIQRDWLSKSLAGSLLGFLLGLGCSGLFMLMGPEMMANVKVQLAMWLVAPVWLTVLSMTFLFRDGRQAWIWLALANLLVFSLYFLLRQF
ncbi:MAG: hypothetical protein PVG66_03615 [Chromatiales bacterium]|jgi:hypothetical protein